MKKALPQLLLILLPWLFLAQKLEAQQRGCYQINVTAGNLSDQLSQEYDQVVSLTLTGELNSSDLACVRSLVNLESLDLLNSRIVLGGTGYTSDLLPADEITVQEVDALPDALLAGHSKIRSVTLPQQLKSIGRYAFDGATQLETITCPESLRILGDYAFARCTSLKSLKLNTHVKSLPEGLFEGCTSLEVVTKSKVTKIGKRAFKDCYALKKYSLSTGLVEVGEEAFLGCSTIEIINIPSTTQRIGDRAFKGCSSLHILFFKTGVKSIGEEAFASCTKLSTVYLPYGMEALPKGLFADCTSLKEISMNKSITRIGSKSFENCSSLRRIHIESVTPPTCESDAFDGINPLSKVNLLVPSEGEEQYKGAPVWSPFNIIGVAANYKGDEVVTIKVKEGTNIPFKFGLRIAQPYSVDLGNGTFLKGSPGTKISARNQVTCDTHGEIVKLFSTPAALTSFLVNDLSDNKIKEISFQSPELDYLWLSSSDIEELSTATLPNLQFLNLTNNVALKTLHLEGNKALQHLDVSLCESLSTLDLTPLKELTFFGASLIEISSWDFSTNTKLRTLDLVATPIESLDISMLQELGEIKLTNCGLKEIRFPNAPKLQTVYLEDNKLDATALNEIYALLPQREATSQAKIFVKGNVGAETSQTSIATAKNWIVDVQGTEPSLPKEMAVNFSTVAKTVKLNFITKDSETVLIDWGDGGKPEQVSSQGGILNQLNHTFATTSPQHEVKIYARTISSIVSPLFSLLELTSLDVSGATSLEVLSLPYSNNLISIDLSANLHLHSIDLSGCNLTSITLPKDLSSLNSLKLTMNELKSIDLTTATNLETLVMASNKFSTIDLSACTHLKKLDLNLNGLTEIIGIHQLTQLEDLDIARNNLPFSMIPSQGSMERYLYNQYWYDIPDKLISGYTVDLSAENFAQGISDKKEQTTFEWYIWESADSKKLISEELYSSETGRFSFSDKLFEGRTEVDIFVIMKNPGFPDINKKVGGLESGLVKFTKGESIGVDPSTFKDIFEGLYENSFFNCPNLTEVLLPQNTKEVRDNAFVKCPQLQTVAFYAESAVVPSSFDDQKGLTVYVPTDVVKATFDEILKFSKAQVVVGVPSAIETPLATGSISIAIQQGELMLKASSTERAGFALYTSRGELVAQGSLEPEEIRSYTLPSAQTYILKTMHETFKVIIP